MGSREVAAVQRAASARWSSTSWFHPGGIAWQWATSPNQREVRLWDDDAWAIAWRSGEWTFVEAQSDERAVDWLLELEPRRAIQVADADTALVERVRDEGFAPGDEFSVDMRRSLDDVPEPAVPEGFTLRSVEPIELSQRAQLHRDVWAPSVVTDEVYDRVVGTPPYDLGLDVVCVAPDGSFAAYALAWLDESTASGELEPVGVHADFRGLGLSKAVCLDALRRLRRAGATECCIHPRGDDGYPIPRRAYASIGFEVVATARVWSQP